VFWAGPARDKAAGWWRLVLDWTAPLINHLTKGGLSMDRQIGRADHVCYWTLPLACVALTFVCTGVRGESWDGKMREVLGKGTTKAEFEWGT
jgi:hypothetical protein